MTHCRNKTGWEGEGGKQSTHLVVRLALARARLPLEAAARHRHDAVLAPRHLGDPVDAKRRDQQVERVAGHLDALELLLLCVVGGVPWHGAQTW